LLAVLAGAFITSLCLWFPAVYLVSQFCIVIAWSIWAVGIRNVCLGALDCLLCPWTCGRMTWRFYQARQRRRRRSKQTNSISSK